MMNSKEDSLRRPRPTMLIAAVLLSVVVIACKHNNTPTAKGLWIANGKNVMEYIPAQLAGGHSAAVPHIMMTSPSVGGPQGVPFDAAGNLWVLDPASPLSAAGTPAIMKFSA